MERAWREVVEGGLMQVAVGSHVDEVITLGRHAPMSDVRDLEGLAARGARVVRVERGGGATAHGPGQLVLYPVVDVRRLGFSIPAFTRVLEEAALAFLVEQDLRGTFEEGKPGIYLDGRKVASLGFRARRGVVTHGLSINVDNDLSLYSYIVACGEPERQPTSVAAAQNRRSRPDPTLEGSAYRDESRRHMERLAFHFLDRAMLRSEP